MAKDRFYGIVKVSGLGALNLQQRFLRTRGRFVVLNLFGIQ
jgi:hypothetical protein